ncbi:MULTISPECIES: flagellar hook-basal body complex protein [Halocynthiibacter]|uniref:Flagellar basal-body rod protein FlgF n=1 Tax=Halocynthiibacter halioticoli TaxID=2986804 RepID=A0AAE3IY74_9RHOB|nr:MULTISPECIES: flagellar hook-basal body complex protein [Halocynthiibacter]MCV6823073.1 flagellar hook-basal body complex protein [Halocynthiibacter halioticoli]MCW4056074.1 flagellar hook-basal body complex protein [Halocynthiibacter sp. SDUM655004]
MDNASYTALTRQTGLRKEMQAVANNIANLSTTGFRKEGVVFAEHIKALDPESESLSMAHASVARTDFSQGALKQTNGTFDLAIEGNGFFLVETEGGQRLSRGGAFLANSEGDLVTPDGARVLDAGQAPIFVPPDALEISIGSDGTLTADGRPISQIGVFEPTETNSLSRENGVRFAFEGDLRPQTESQVLQGFVEDSNVNPIIEVSRMIEVQRAYEQGQNFLEKEDERIRSVLRTLG